MVRQPELPVTLRHMESIFLAFAKHLTVEKTSIFFRKSFVKIKIYNGEDMILRGMSTLSHRATSNQIVFCVFLPRVSFLLGKNLSTCL